MKENKVAAFVGCKPRYEHDCENCTFVGQVLDADMYICVCARSPHTSELEPRLKYIVLRRSSEVSDTDTFSSFESFSFFLERLLLQAED